MWKKIKHDTALIFISGWSGAFLAYIFNKAVEDWTLKSFINSAVIIILVLVFVTLFLLVIYSNKPICKIFEIKITKKSEWFFLFLWIFPPLILMLLNYIYKDVGNIGYMLGLLALIYTFVFPKIISKIKK